LEPDDNKQQDRLMHWTIHCKVQLNQVTMPCSYNLWCKCNISKVNKIWW